MSKKFALPLAAAVLLTLIAAAPRPAYRESFLPPNDLRIPVSTAGNKGISRDQYDAVMNRVQALYGPIIAARGGNLVINRLWDDETVNASAERQGNDYVINMYGGLARHPSITQDGMALVACHELGHHLGGAPKYGGMDWAANEGEADYFANSKCLHRVFGSSASKNFTRPKGDDELAKKDCAASYKTSGERAICQRSAAAGMSVTQLFRALRQQDAQPHYDTPDLTQVTEMFDAHPETQCRLDTYYAASLCTAPFTQDISETDPSVGACSHSQGYKVGFRPRCWYLPPAGDRLDEAGVADVKMTHTRAVKSSSLASLSTDIFSGL